MRDFENFLKEMYEFYDNLDWSYSGRKPENNEIRNKISMTAKKYGVPIFGEGTNRTVFENNGYVYKLAHKRGATYDNIGEKSNTEYIKRKHPELMPHIAEATKYIGNEYMLEEEMITPIFEFEGIDKFEGSDGERALQFLMERADDYDYLIELLSRAFILMDASPKSIFNYGLKTTRSRDGRRQTTLANLDYAYFVPKDGALICPTCGNGELKYDKIDLHYRNNQEREKIIKTVKSINEEQYVCTNEGCQHHKGGRGIAVEDVIQMYEDGQIQTERYQSGPGSRRGGYSSRSYERTYDRGYTGNTRGGYNDGFNR